MFEPDYWSLTADCADALACRKPDASAWTWHFAPVRRKLTNCRRACRSRGSGSEMKPSENKAKTGWQAFIGECLGREDCIAHRNGEGTRGWLQSLLILGSWDKRRWARQAVFLAVKMTFEFGCGLIPHHHVLSLPDSKIINQLRRGPEHEMCCLRAMRRGNGTSIP